MLNDNMIYGETEATDCPEDASYCLNDPDKYGFQLAGLATQAKKLHETQAPMLPMYKIMSFAPWGGM